MSIDVSRFCALRPYLYHLTAKENIARISRTKTLSSAAVLYGLAEKSQSVRVKRFIADRFELEGEPIHLRDQAVLYKGKMRLQGGWDFETLIEELNKRVFFWPGSASAPIDYGKRHFSRYESSETPLPCIIRVRLEKLVEANPRATMQLCRYNSGSPRTVKGLGSPRGPETFLSPDKADFRPCDVREVTFVNSVKLPSCTQVATVGQTRWTALFS